jgi:tripartite-type tricarboxylate transporter receptor subunit TctC
MPRCRSTRQSRLAALARENPGKITLAITALGSVSHLGLVLYQSAAGVKFQQVRIAVPHRR